MFDLKCGDCYELIRDIPDKSVDLVITDPPYLIETKGCGLYKRQERPYMNEISTMRDGFSEEILDELCRVMKKINIYIFCSQKQIIPLVDYFVKNKKCNWNLLTWHKTNPVPACGNKYLTDTEYILFFREKGVKIFGEFKTKFTYYVTQVNKKEKKLYNHPTVKPVEIIQNLVVNSSNDGDIVLDCFMGTGSTGVACAQTHRNFIGFEINDEYFATANERILNA